MWRSLQAMEAWNFVINLMAVLVIPVVIFSFWKISKRAEFKELRDSGHKLNLNLYNLIAGFRRSQDDPLRNSHVKLAKIGLIHWALVPLGFFGVMVFGTIVHLIAT